MYLQFSLRDSDPASVCDYMCTLNNIIRLYPSSKILIVTYYCLGFAAMLVDPRLYHNWDTPTPPNLPRLINLFPHYTAQVNVRLATTGATIMPNTDVKPLASELTKWRKS